MEVTLRKQGDVVIVAVSGRVDAATTKPLEEQLMQPIDKGEKKILVDCSKLDYISSAGLRVFLMAIKKLKPVQGKIVLCALKDAIKTMFDIAGFSAIFPIISTEEEALKEFVK